MSDSKKFSGDLKGQLTDDHLLFRLQIMMFLCVYLMSLAQNKLYCQTSRGFVICCLFLVSCACYMNNLWKQTIWCLPHFDTMETTGYHSNTEAKFIFTAMENRVNQSAIVGCSLNPNLEGWKKNWLWTVINTHGERK